MAKKTTTKKKTTGSKKTSRRSQSIKVADAKGKHLVIVESPTKAKTINKYLGNDYLVMASVGHVRDLPSRNPKGVKNPVPGVDLEHRFEPTYEILPDKKKTVNELKKAAKHAEDVWFATDLDREGEAIAWHLAHALEIEVPVAKRVVFNAITKSEIARAFEKPRPIDENRVNAQQARRIVDRIVGYQVSPLLWKKVAGGLSAGRVQSVAVRLVVEREREIDAFIPEESWRLAALLATDPAKSSELTDSWKQFLEGATENGRTVKEQNVWLSEHEVLRAELIGIDGADVKNADRETILGVAKRLGYDLEKLDTVEDPKGKGPAKELITAIGGVSSTPPAYAIESISTKRTTSKPGAPFITSSLQQAAANRLGFALQRTMRVAQQLYEGIDLGGARGQTGLITYMRTDSTHLAPEAIGAVRDHIGSAYGDEYLPEKANYYSSSNKSAQEAHEAIRPTDVTVRPSDIRGKLNDDQFKLYDLIWKRFVSCQMVPAKWDATTVQIAAELSPGKATLKATGRKLVFDGFYRVTGVPQSDDVVLPELSEGQAVAPVDLNPTQHFTSPPPRYTEASLQKKLEEEGIGRPSTYAAIIQTIQDRKYVEPIMPRDRRLCATDLGMVVTDMLIEAFPEILNVAYTREMEAQLDHIEDDRNDWQAMVSDFYEPFVQQLEKAHEELMHAKAVTEPAPHKCEQCGADTVYRFGKNGRFLSCSRYPDCKYAAPIDREGNPQSPEMTDILCPVDGEPMIRRTGRFGPFLAASTYPEVKFILKLDPKKGHVVLPKTPPMLTGITCPKCEDKELYLRESKRGPWLSCSGFPKCRGRMAWSSLDEEKQAELEKKWAEHQKENPLPEIRTASGRVLKEGDDYIPQVAGSEEPAGSVVARDDAA